MKKLILFTCLLFGTDLYADSSRVGTLFRHGGSVQISIDPFYYELFEHLSPQDAAKFFDLGEHTRLKNNVWHEDPYSHWPGAAFAIYAGRKKNEWKKKDAFVETAAMLGARLAVNLDYITKEFAGKADSTSIHNYKISSRYDELMLGLRRNYFGKEAANLRILLGWQLWFGTMINSRSSLSYYVENYGKAVYVPEFQKDIKLQSYFNLSASVPLGFSLRLFDNLSALLCFEPGAGYVKFSNSPGHMRTTFSVNYGLRYDW